MQVFQSISYDPLILTLYNSCVQAGFPSPADDYMDKDLNLNEYLISSPSSSFFVRVTGDSMIGAGIMDGCLLVVDKAKKVTDRKIVIAVVNGEFTVKRIKINKDGHKYLIAENENYPPIKLNEEAYIWGVVIAIINKL